MFRNEITTLLFRKDEAGDIVELQKVNSAVFNSDSANSLDHIPISSGV